jgi:hypothetical protein
MWYNWWVDPESTQTHQEHDMQNLVRISLPVLLLGFSLDASAEDGQKRASSPTYGVGVGLTAPSDSLALSTISIRYRQSKKLTLEPMLGYTSGTSTTTTTSTASTIDDEGNEVSVSTDVEQTSEATYLEAGLNVRYSIARRDTVDAYALVGGSFTSYGTDTSTEGVDGTATEEVSAMAVYYGIGLENWLNPHCSASFDVFSVGYSDIQTETTTVGGTSDSTSASSALGFDPQVRVMMHIYF